MAIETDYKEKLEFSRPALVFSGGATKAAAFHIGVCLALREKGFSFVGGRAESPTPANALPYPPPKYHPFEISTYVGSSAGAFLVAMLAAGIRLESIINSFTDDPKIRINGPYSEIPRITYADMLTVAWPRPSAIIKSLQKTSLFGKTLESLILRNMRLPGFFTTKGFAEYLRRHILPTDCFHELKANLFVIGTQLDHSRKIVFCRFGTEKTYDPYCQYASNVPISEAVAASMSLPPIFIPYLVRHAGGKQRFYIDGEIRETLSTHVARDFGCDLMFCSYTHQPYHFDETIGSLSHYGLPAIMVQSVYQAIEQKVYQSEKDHHDKIEALATVREFFREKQYGESDLTELCNRLQERLDFSEKTKFLFIHPEPRDKEMFFGDHFTLNPKTLQEVVTIGYKRAMTELRKYDLVAAIDDVTSPTPSQTS